MVTFQEGGFGWLWLSQRPEEDAGKRLVLLEAQTPFFSPWDQACRDGWAPRPVPCVLDLSPGTPNAGRAGAAGGPPGDEVQRSCLWRGRRGTPNSFLWLLVEAVVEVQCVPF